VSTRASAERVAEATGRTRDPVLERECDVFARYLTGGEPVAYARDHYQRAHEVAAEALEEGADSPLERRLLEWGRRGGLGLRAADAWSRFFRPGALLRRKLVLTLAILENGPPTHRSLNAPREGRSLLLLGEVAGRVALSVAALVLGVVVFGPAALREGRRS